MFFSTKSLVDLTYFKTENAIKTKGVTISWNVNIAENIKAYILEKSSNGISYKEVKTIPHDSTIKEYSITDTAKTSACTYYRLRVIDTDDHSIIKTIGSVVNYQPPEGKPCLIEASHSPLVSMATISESECSHSDNGVIAIDMIDITGTMVHNFFPYSYSENKFTFKVNKENNFSPGLYIVRVKKEEGDIR